MPSESEGSSNWGKHAFALVAASWALSPGVVHAAGAEDGGAYGSGSPNNPNTFSSPVAPRGVGSTAPGSLAQDFKDTYIQGMRQGMVGHTPGHLVPLHEHLKRELRLEGFTPFLDHADALVRRDLFGASAADELVDGVKRALLMDLVRAGYGSCISLL